VARNAKFLKNSLITQEASGSLKDLEHIQEEYTHSSIDTSLNHKEDGLEIDEPQSDIIPIRRSTRTRRPTDRMCLYIDAEEHELGDLDNSAIRILIAIAAFYDYKILQMDVKTAFLNGYLSEEVYMEQPEDVKSYLGRVFTMKDLGEAAYILGIKIYRDRSRRLIDKLRLSKSQGASTPAELKRMQNVPHASAVGSIMYAVRWFLATLMLDICWMLMTSSLRLDMCSFYMEVLLIGRVPSKATSSVEAEYIVAYDASNEAVWVRKFIYGLGVIPTIKEPINMYCDNTIAITIANESGITKGARHCHTKVHYLHEVIEFSDIKLEKVHTYDNLADPFTKALAFPKHSEHTKNIGMLPASSLM
ncbi:retrotransposon protein, putative, ty1-copia subclass, partial [Tanacetum coccineum]